MNQQKQPSDLDLGRDWLERSAFSVDHVDRAARPDALEFARVAAMIGSGFVQLGAIAQVAAWRAEDLARIAAEREAESENDEVVREANRLALARERAELDLVEQRKALLGELDVSTLAASGLREQRDAAEARPHDDGPSLADRLITIANSVYGNDTRHVLDAPTGHGLAAVVRELADGPLIQTQWAAAQFRKLADELEIARGGGRG